MEILDRNEPNDLIRVPQRDFEVQKLQVRTTRGSEVCGVGGFLSDKRDVLERSFFFALAKTQIINVSCFYLKGQYIFFLFLSMNDYS